MNHRLAYNPLALYAPAYPLNCKGLVANGPEEMKFLIDAVKCQHCKFSMTGKKVSVQGYRRSYNEITKETQ